MLHRSARIHEDDPIHENSTRADIKETHKIKHAITLEARAREREFPSLRMCARACSRSHRRNGSETIAVCACILFDAFHADIPFDPMSEPN